MGEASALLSPEAPPRLDQGSVEALPSSQLTSHNEAPGWSGRDPPTSPAVTLLNSHTCPQMKAKVGIQVGWVIRLIHLICLVGKGSTDFFLIIVITV